MIKILANSFRRYKNNLKNREEIISNGKKKRFGPKWLSFLPFHVAFKRYIASHVMPKEVQSAEKLPIMHTFITILFRLFE